MEQKKSLIERKPAEYVAHESVQRFYSLINKSYLSQIKEFDLIPFDESNIAKRDGINFRLIEITKIVYNDKKSIAESLLNVLGALHPQYFTGLLLKSNGTETKLYACIKAFSDEHPASSGLKLFRQALEGNFPGTEYDDSLDRYSIDDILAFDDFKEENDTWSIGTTTLIPSLKNTDNENFSQGLERFIDAMYGKEYTALILAEPISNNDLELSRLTLETVATTLSPLLKTKSNLGINESEAISESFSKSVSQTITEGITMSQNYTRGESQSISHSKGHTTNRAGVGTMLGTGAGIAVGGLVSIFAPPVAPIALSAGGALGGFIGRTMAAFKGEDTTTDTFSKSTTQSETEGLSVQRSRSSGTSTTDTHGTTRQVGKQYSIDIEETNKSVERVLEKIDQQLKRIDESKNYGFWNSSFYILADSSESTKAACSLMKSILQGEGSSVEEGATIVYSKSDKEKRDQYLEYFNNIAHPRFRIKGQETVWVTPSSLLSGKELALIMNLPRRSVSGLPVIEIPEFGQDIVLQTPISGDATPLDLGVIYHYGKERNKSKVNLDVNSLVRHTFITGSTGSGKTNAIVKMLYELMKTGRKFLVVEPAKGEYKELLGGHPNVNVYGTNPAHTPLLKLNPFEFPEHIHVLEHIDRLVEIFNACWPMYAAMPAILKDGIARVYLRSGWNLEFSVCVEKTPVFPTIADLADILPVLIEESLYSGELKSNYSGALVTRVASLNTGLSGLIFADKSIPDEELFESNCIIDISRVGSQETKSLLMGLIFLKLNEYRLSKSEFSDSLKHITVLEEAHHLLRKTSMEQGQESSNLQGKSVEMLTNAISEMRAYGQGFIISDQAPGLLDPAVIRNTNTKMILKLPEEEDRNIVGTSAFLNEAQIREIPRFPTGVAAIYQNNWIMPVLCKIDLFKDKKGYVHSKKDIPSYSYYKTMTNRLLSVLLRDSILKEEREEVEKLSEGNYVELIDFIRSQGYRNKEYIVQLVEKIMYEGYDSAFRTYEDDDFIELITDIVDFKIVARTAYLKAYQEDYESWTNLVRKDLLNRYGVSCESLTFAIIGLFLERIKNETKDKDDKIFAEEWDDWLRSKLLK
ncbi:MAG: DUF87 domain-containing protein [Candidatus Cloacimonadia bacterium]